MTERFGKVSELKLSDFKMFEKAPYEKPDSRNIMEVFIGGAKDKEKVYGLAFTTEFIKYALKALSNQTGKETPEDIKTLEQLKEYLISKSNELQTPPYFLVLWAQFVTDKKFEGALAVGTQLMIKGATKRVAESDVDMKLKNVDVDENLAKLRKLAVDMKVAPLEFGYKKNEDGSVDLFHGGCHFYEGCQISSKQGLLKRLDGRIMCGTSLYVCQFLKMGTGYEWDHTVLEFSEAHCIARCFMI